MSVVRKGRQSGTFLQAEVSCDPPRTRVCFGIAPLQRTRVHMCARVIANNPPPAATRAQAQDIGKPPGLLGLLGGWRDLQPAKMGMGGLPRAIATLPALQRAPTHAWLERVWQVHGATMRCMLHVRLEWSYTPFVMEGRICCG